jgi:RNA polymerase sigma-B factor
MAGSPKRRSASAANDVAALLQEFHASRDAALREQIALTHGALVRYLARKFAFRGEPLEDLVQVAHIGLLNAIDRYDPNRGVQFVTYATTTIVGEIKRYFRDKSWSVHVPRRLRELNNQLMRALSTLSATGGRSPTVAEMAQAVGVSFEEAVEALEVGRAYNPVSLDADVGASEEDDAAPLKDYLGGIDPELGRLEDRHTVEDALRRLPDREQTVLRMRYYEELSQAEIARRLGISQMHVSRIQREALRRLREVVED